MKPKLDPIHIERLVRTPESETPPENGAIVTDVVAQARLQELGLVTFHPNVVHDESGKQSTWTRTRAGDIAVALMIGYLENFLSGEEL